MHNRSLKVAVQGPVSACPLFIHSFIRGILRSECKRDVWDKKRFTKYVRGFNFCFIWYKFGSRDSLVGIATGQRLHEQGMGIDARQGQEMFLFSIVSRPGLCSTQPPILWVPEVLPRGIKLITHFHLVPRLIMPGAVLPFPIHLNGVVLN
jgi:hypothetical protein